MVGWSTAMRRAPFMVAIVLAVMLAACASDEDPTPTSVTTPVLPEATTPVAAPTVTAEPTVAPTVAVPTAAPTVAVPTAAPTMAATTIVSTMPAPTTIPVPVRTPIPIDELEITEDTTFRHVITALSDDEVSCVQDMVGAEAFNVVLDVPLSLLPEDVGQIPPGCLSDENAIGMSVAFLSREAGRLDAETRSCLREAVARTPSALGLGEQPDDQMETIIGTLTMQMCLSDEVAAALAMGGDNEIPPPSALRCLASQLGGTEALLVALAEGQEDPNAILELMLAAYTCEPDLNSASSP